MQSILTFFLSFLIFLEIIYDLEELMKSFFQRFDTANQRFNELAVAQIFSAIQISGN